MPCLVLQFQKAIEVAGEEFMHTAREVVLSWLPARAIVERCMTARAEVHPSREIMLLDQVLLPTCT